MGLVLTIGILYGLLNTNNKQRRWSSIMLFIFMITGFLIFKELIFVFLNNFLKRLGDPSDLNSITTGRYGILKNYFSIYFSNPLTLIFGSGNQYHHYLGEVSGRVAHNTYFDVILSWGAIGLFAFTYIVYKWVKKLPRINNKSWIRWLPLITILINFLDLSCLSASMFWLVFSVPILALRTKNEEVLIDNQDIFKKTNAFYKKSAYGINDYA